MEETQRTKKLAEDLAKAEDPAELERMEKEAAKALETAEAEFKANKKAAEEKEKAAKELTSKLQYQQKLA